MDALAWIVHAPLAVFAIGAGLARFRYASAPLVASAAIVVLFVVYLAVYLVWAASCGDCSAPGGPEWDRFEAMPMWYLMGMMYGVGALALVWIGAGLAALVGWIRSLEDPGRVDG